MAVATKEQPRLKQRYDSEIRDQLKEQLGLANVMQVPRLEKIVVNMGVGRATQQPSLLEGAVADLTIITGQKPLVTKATKSIAGFKLREGQSIGAKVTLRGDRMWEFFDRLISSPSPASVTSAACRPTRWDGRGNYTFGVNEQLIFPEIDYDQVDVTRGMDITIVTSAAGQRRRSSPARRLRVPVRERRDRRRDALQPAPTRRIASRREERGQVQERAIADGQEGADPEATAQAQVQGPGLHPLPPLWPAALGVPQVRPVPDLPPRARARRRGARRHQGELVRGGAR